jgi:hypothetical protein
MMPAYSLTHSLVLSLIQVDPVLPRNQCVPQSTHLGPHIPAHHSQQGQAPQAQHLVRSRSVTRACVTRG